MGQADHHQTRNGLNQWAGKEEEVRGNKDPQKKSWQKGFFGEEEGPRFLINLKSGSSLG